MIESGVVRIEGGSGGNVVVNLIGVKSLIVDVVESGRAKRLKPLIELCRVLYEQRIIAGNVIEAEAVNE